MFKGVTDDKFFISIEKEDSLFHSSKTLDYLKELGAINVELVEE